MASSSEHILSLKESSSFTCNLCWEKGSGPVYQCSKAADQQCEFNIHVACAAMAKLQTHFTHHEHPLRLCQCNIGFICNGCGDNIRSWAFSCHECEFDMHPMCVRAPRFILHPSHNLSHPLSLYRVPRNTFKCNGCKEAAKKKFYVYRCSTCNFDLHLSCASLPRKIHHAQHARHVLTLCYEISNDFYCSGCNQMGKGWQYLCSDCGFYLHAKCGSFSHGFSYANLDNNHVQMQTNLGSNSSLSSPSGSLQTTITVDDLEALERVLCFTRRTLELRSKSGPSAPPDENANESEEDICPTYLEGFTGDNPKVTTSCNHWFHLHCILGWMEQNTKCPVCWQSLRVLV